MVTRDEVKQYFVKKKYSWELDGSVTKHVSKVGKEGLVLEFRADPGFEKVCQFAKKLTIDQLTSPVEDMEDVISSVLGYPVGPTIDIILGAIDIACGYNKTGDNLVKIGLGVVAAIAFVVILSAILGNN